MDETYTGRVRDGVVVFEGQPPPLPEGTEVRVEPVQAGIVTNEANDRIAGTRTMLLSWAKRAEALAPPLPSDLAAEHDHYAHGKPRS